MASSLLHGRADGGCWTVCLLFNTHVANRSGRRRSGNEKSRGLGNVRLDRCPGNQGILSSDGEDIGHRSGCKHDGPHEERRRLGNSKLVRCLGN